jgi:hypothetical protein
MRCKRRLKNLERRRCGECLLGEAQRRQQRQVDMAGAQLGDAAAVAQRTVQLPAGGHGQRLLHATADDAHAQVGGLQRDAVPLDAGASVGANEKGQPRLGERQIALRLSAASQGVDQALGALRGVGEVEAHLRGVAGGVEQQPALRHPHQLGAAAQALQRGAGPFHEQARRLVEAVAVAAEHARNGLVEKGDAQWRWAISLGLGLNAR